jgi:hypothetical protein
MPEGNRLHLSLPVTQPREAQEDDKYYPLLENITEERLWHTSDIVKIIQGSEVRDMSRTADIAAMMDALGVPYHPIKTKR